MFSVATDKQVRNKLEVLLHNVFLQCVSYAALNLYYLSWVRANSSEQVNSKQNTACRQIHIHTYTQTLSSSSAVSLCCWFLSPCRQCYLPNVSKKGEMGNETDACKGAVWVICLIQGLMGSEGIKRLKQRFSFLPPSPTLHLFPALLLENVEKQWLYPSHFLPVWFGVKWNPTLTVS